MAKYTVNHTCGHTQTHELFGPMKERDWKIAWLETTSCKACWIAEQRKSRAAEPITGEVIFNPFSDGFYLAVTGGDTYSIKDALKAAGCRWMEYQDNNDILGLQKPRKAWMIKIDLENKAETMTIIQRLYDVGVTRIEDTLNPLSAAIAIQLAKE